jgi:DNA polymerase I-like protein with 3'-5' exonuclease and polymerase domains
MKIVFDIEADNLLPGLTEIFCICTEDVDSGEAHAFHDDPLIPRNGTVYQGIEYLKKADELIGHNIIGYDLKALQRLYPSNQWEQVFLYDTLAVVGLLFPGDELKIRDIPNNRIPGKLKGRRSLEAWGYRLDSPKLEILSFRSFSEEMLSYCKQDVSLNHKLYKFLIKKDVPEKALHIELEFFKHIQDQIELGVHVDEEALDRLIKVLTIAQAEAADALAKYFTPIQVPDILESLEAFNLRKRESKHPSRLKRKTIQKAAYRVFNPASRIQIANRLQADYGWVPDPKQQTPSGRPRVDEAVLKELPYECIPALVQYLLISKRLGQTSVGKASWLNMISKTGKLHGYVNHQGTVTSRCSHSKPNLGQVPRVGNPFGEECRAVFIPKPGWLLTGCDAKGLELRMLGHFTVPFDGGAFRDMVLLGDPHTANMKALSLTDRNLAKTWFYAWLYGAQDGKLSSILGCTSKEAAETRRSFEEKISGLSKLKTSLEKGLIEGGMAYYNIKWGKRNLVLNKNAQLRGLDGRRIPCRSPHSLLNAYNQSAGAVLVKVATNIFHKKMAFAGCFKRHDYNMVLHVHDEFQLEHPPEGTPLICASAEQAFREAGQFLNLQCPMAGDAKTGANWSETH